jgi:hypothetical protein
VLDAVGERSVQGLMLSPGSSNIRAVIGDALLLKGEPQAALEAIQVEESDFSMIGLALVYHALGRADESDAALAELIEQSEQVASYNIAYVLAYRGEADRAFEWLDKPNIHTRLLSETKSLANKEESIYIPEVSFLASCAIGVISLFNRTSDQQLFVRIKGLVRSSPR